MISRPGRLILAAIGLVFILSVLFHQSGVNPASAARSWTGRYNLNALKDPYNEGAEKDLILYWNHEPVPRRDFTRFAHLPPQNMDNPKGYAYSTLYCTRNGDVRGPYFNAVQNIVWRILYGPERSKHPVIVFVCPFTGEDQRTILRGQGAIVKEIALLDGFFTDGQVLLPRWKDVFAKVNIWAEVEFKKIMFLDSDAFPVKNADDLFDIALEQDCKPELMDPVALEIYNSGRPGAETMCKYTFAGVNTLNLGEVNAGTLVLSPNIFMHERLLTNARHTESYPVTHMEQGLFQSNVGFGVESAFPIQWISPIYNSAGYYEVWRDDARTRAEMGDLRIIHAKLWNHFTEGARPELNVMWDLDWMKMCRFYDEDLFIDVRQAGKMGTDGEIFLQYLEAMEAKKAEKAAKGEIEEPIVEPGVVGKS